MVIVSVRVGLIPVTLMSCVSSSPVGVSPASPCLVGFFVLSSASESVSEAASDWNGTSSGRSLHSSAVLPSSGCAWSLSRFGVPAVAGWGEEVGSLGGAPLCRFCFSLFWLMSFGFCLARALACMRYMCVALADSSSALGPSASTAACDSSHIHCLPFCAGLWVAF